MKFARALYIILLLSSSSFVYAQIISCGGTFGEPIFEETFGVTANSSLTIAPPIQPPAYTTYQYVNYFPPNDGQYTVSNQIHQPSWNWHTSYDHTQDANNLYGNMLVVNADYTPGEFYRRTVDNLCAQQIYRFSAWVMNIAKYGITPNVTFQVETTNGNILGSVSTGEIANTVNPEWINYYFDFQLEPEDTEINLVLINNAPGGNGNDIAIDDITFSPCGSDTSISSSIPEILSSGVCSANEDITIEAETDNIYETPYYIWQTSYDNGNTWNNLSEASTDNIIILVANSYQNNQQIRFIIGEGENVHNENCRIISESATIHINIPEIPTVSSPYTFCINSTINESELNIEGENIKWYTSETDTEGVYAMPNIDTSSTGNISYWITQTINQCESEKTEVEFTIYDTEIPSGNTLQEFCSTQNATIEDIEINGNNVIWYDEAINGNVLNEDTLLIDGNTYYASQTLSNCESSNRLSVHISLVEADIPANNYEDSICDEFNDGSETINLTNYNENLLIGSQNYIFSYYDENMNEITDYENYTISNEETLINVEIQSLEGCIEIFQLTLYLNPIPVLELVEEVELCNDVSIELDAGDGFTSYMWNTGEETQTITVNEIGNYTVTVSNDDDCESTATISVVEVQLPIITSIVINGNSATVQLSTGGNYLYSLDNINWQSSNQFTNLENDVYTVYVKTEDNCAIGNEQFSIFFISNTITPNNDGNNDTWEIKGLELYENSTVTIYDRYGKIILHHTIKEAEPFVWNGKYGGRSLPTGSYWYTINTNDGREFSGYLTIKNSDR